MKRIYVDMDGTLNKWRNVQYIERLYEKGFFLNAEPNKNVVSAVRSMTADPKINVYILSAV